MQRNVFAFTAPGFEPAYISFNRQDDGRLTIDARSPASISGQAQMTLPDEELPALIKALKAELARALPNGGNSGHGHVWKRPDGLVARCGGPKMCAQCARDEGRFGV